MFGFFGILRPGALIDDEELNQLNEQLARLKIISNWSTKIAQLISPGNMAPIVDSLEAFIYNVNQTKRNAPVMHLRYFRAVVDQMLTILQGQVAPAPAPAPMPVAAPAPAASMQESNPPAPPGLICPEYDRSLTAPINWNDQAAAQRYLDLYPDVKKAVVELKRQPSAIWHYRCYGQKEGRTWAGLGGLRPGRINPRSNHRRPGYLR